MPRRNLIVLFVVAIVSLICYQRTPRNRYGETVARAIDLVAHHALEPLPAGQLYEAAMSGMMSGLDDYSGFVPAERLQRFTEEIDQEFAGVGLEVRRDEKSGELIVGSPLVGSPAQRAGIRAGDRIVRIDQRPTRDLSLDDAVRLMRGRPGARVTLALLRPGEEKERVVELVREVVQVDTVSGYSRNADGSWNYLLPDHPQIALTSISSFGKETAHELRRVLDDLSACGMKALVLDVRDDRGGLLRAAIAVCELFLEEGVIVTTRGRSGDHVREEYRAAGNAPFAQLPLAVLINGDTASASEIVAACLQDHARAAIVGQRSYGKGTVQEIFELEPGRGALRLTTASYWRPSGQNIHRRRNAKPDEAWGVMPDEGLQIVFDAEQLRRWRLSRLKAASPAPPESPAEEPAEPFVDRQIGAAVQHLLERLGEAPARQPSDQPKTEPTGAATSAAANGSPESAAVPQ